ncbi:hypothetical protein SAMN02745883_00771 [Caminicella sporogenes DSM 14501]|uniref:Uncharacterized protein n=1 Tax=Caminicella sporogenes DSM 14501 TaxID=1121266 RepID=A0A1M6N2T1_9FIRM|nr:hypothetical protein [Caminicella sporogenes]RKD22386.1 hypothetical protein BET04_04960 [Caminicella sporogenes]SHJ89994.1 hypothetical protein SAMN02745883_00771 [Caminicella sporogenes DSM 14501]
MTPIEFGIIDKIDKNKEYIKYEPEKYNCVTIDDDIYIDDWWEELSKMKTYFGDLNSPNMSLARHGVTLIPPESLSILETIVSNDPRIKQDYSLMELLKLIRKAKLENKYMIHFGV